MFVPRCQCSSGSLGARARRVYPTLDPRDGEEVRAHAEERGFSFELSECVEESFAAMHIAQAFVEVREQPRRPLYRHCLVVCETRIGTFRGNLLGMMKVRRREIRGMARRIAVPPIAHVRCCDGGECGVVEIAVAKTIEHRRE